MSDFQTICDLVSDLPRFMSLDYKVVERGLVEGLEAFSSEALEDKLAPVRSRLEPTLKLVQQEFVARDDAVEAIMASLISGVPAVLLGPPGTAKSAIVRELARRCGLGPGQQSEGDDAQGYFEYLLTSHTMPEELFGAPNLKLLTSESVFERNTDGMLPRAQLAFLDEVFRGGGHILNTLLSLLNERLFHDGRTLRRVPLVGILAAANDPPVDPDLNAFFDRFPIRVWLDSIFEEKPQDVDENQIHLLLQASARHEVRSLKSSYGDISSAVITVGACMHDFRCARAIVTKRLEEEYVVGTGDRGAKARTVEFLDLFQILFRQARLSDRTLFSLRRFAASLSWLTEGPGFHGAHTAHFRTFSYLARNSQERARIERDVHDAMQGSGLTSVQ